MSTSDGYGERLGAGAAARPEAETGHPPYAVSSYPSEGSRPDQRADYESRSRSREALRPAGGDYTARAGRPDPAAARAPAAAGARGPRRARLTIRRVDPWSVLKFSFVFSLALLVVLLVAVAALYWTLDTMGVFDSVNRTVRDLTDSGGDNPTGGLDVLFTAKSVLGTTALLGAVNVVLVTALATLGAFIYNLCADLVGGIEVTLSERD